MNWKEILIKKMLQKAKTSNIVAAKFAVIYNKHIVHVVKLEREQGIVGRMLVVFFVFVTDIVYTAYVQVRDVCRSDTTMKDT